VAELGVNIDHVATVRQARRANEPDPVWAAVEAELGGADCITLHLREDRRHIQDRDLRVLRETVSVKLNLELACAAEVLAIAAEVCPTQVTIVPESRQEVTTEGGLDVVGGKARIAKAIEQMKQAGIIVSLFLDPEQKQIELAKELGADAVELHTGQYALAKPGVAQAAELARLKDSAAHIVSMGLTLHAGHGLNYHNVRPVASLPEMCELNIGHSIVARALMVGMAEAVRQMKSLISG
jgi:pyridoxine 5-phosphate synthase